MEPDKEDDLQSVTPTAWSQHSSEDRNDRGFGEGPHCHVNQQSDEAAYPSHKAHVHAGGDVFVADPDCDGDPG